MTTKNFIMKTDAFLDKKFSLIEMVNVNMWKPQWIQIESIIQEPSYQ